MPEWTDVIQADEYLDALEPDRPGQIVMIVKPEHVHNAVGDLPTPSCLYMGETWQAIVYKADIRDVVRRLTGRDVSLAEAIRMVFATAGGEK